MARAAAGKGTGSVRDLRAAIAFWRDRGCETAVFVPRYWVQSRHSRGGGERLSPEDFEELQGMVRSGSVAVTPGQDEDDLYTIDYAAARGEHGWVLSNDRFRDHASLLSEEAEAFRKWRDERVISFAFVGNDLVPNPRALLRMRRQYAARATPGGGMDEEDDDEEEEDDESGLGFGPLRA